MRASDDGDVANFPALSTRSTRRLIFGEWALMGFGAKGNLVMRQVAVLMRKASSRIGHRLAELIAIAAASLPEVGV